jgi:hypothetical protein
VAEEAAGSSQSISGLPDLSMDAHRALILDEPFRLTVAFESYKLLEI